MKNKQYKSVAWANKKIAELEKAADELNELIFTVIQELGNTNFDIYEWIETRLNRNDESLVSNQ